MARGVNKAILIGNLGRDPELRYTQSGTAVCNFSLATTESIKQKDKWVDHTEWHNVVVFGKNAENVNKYLSKGSSVYIEGRIQTRKWQDRDGNDKYTTEIISNDIQFLGGSKGARTEGARDAASDAGFPQGGGEPPEFDPNDDVPF